MRSPVRTENFQQGADEKAKPAPKRNPLWFGVFSPLRRSGPFAIAILLAYPSLFSREVADDMKVTVLKSSGEIYARSAFSPEWDIVSILGKGLNGQIDFQCSGLVKRGTPMTVESCRAMDLIHACPDDSTPWKLNGTFIGANHGWSGVFEVTTTGHGLGTADLGSRWTDARGRRGYLIRVVDADKLWFMPENEGTLEKWKFSLEAPESPLKQEGGQRSLDIGKPVKTQLRPSCRIKRQEFLVDGKFPLKDGEAVTCSNLEIVEEYDIINPAAVLDKFKAQPGVEVDLIDPDSDTLLTNKIVYQLQPWGACTIRHEARVNRPFNLDYMGFIQTRVMVRQPADSLRYYIPGTLPFSTKARQWDFRQGQDFSERPAEPLLFNASMGNLEFPDRLPHRFIQVLEKRSGGKKPLLAGYVVGYSLLEGVTVPPVRAARCANALTIHTSAKTYPAAMDKKMGRIPEGTIFECLAYRQYFDPSAFSSNATALYWHRQGETYVLHADYHKAVDHDVIRLPKVFSGMKISIVEASPSVRLLTGETVTDEGIALSVSGNSGGIILALNRSGDTTSPQGM